MLPLARLSVRYTNLNASVPHALALYPLRVSCCTISWLLQQHVLDLAPAAHIGEAAGSACVTPEPRLASSVPRSQLLLLGLTISAAMAIELMEVILCRRLTLSAACSQAPCLKNSPICFGSGSCRWRATSELHKMHTMLFAAHDGCRRTNMRP